MKTRKATWIGKERKEYGRSRNFDAGWQLVEQDQGRETTILIRVCYFGLSLHAYIDTLNPIPQACSNSPFSLNDQVPGPQLTLLRLELLLSE